MFPRGCSCAGQFLNSLLLLQYRCWIEIRCAVIHVFCSLYPMLICLIMLSFPRQYRKCFFTCENSHQLKQDFMKYVNRSMKAGGFLTCSFRDNEFGDFLLHKKRLCSASHLKLKKAVSYCGLQLNESRQIVPESVWVLGPNVIIDKRGQLIDREESEYVWLSARDCRTVGLPGPIALSVSLPLGSAGLVKLIDALSTMMQHNFHPAILTLGAAVMVLHYTQLLRKRGHCHVTVLFGNSQTGKTSALLIALSLFGCHHQTFFERGSKEAYLHKCCISSLPVGCDDPQSQATTGQLIVELFNGAKCTLMKSGDMSPLTSTIISANFNLSETAK